MFLSLLPLLLACMSEPIPFELSSLDFEPQSVIPTELTCEGRDRSPALRWRGLPKGTRSLALLIEDPDAPDPAAPRMTWSHWVVYGLTPETEGLAGSNRGLVSVPAGAAVGLNDWKKSEYGGPCPPIGQHRYVHRLFALDAPLDSAEVFDRAGLLAAMEGHQLAETQLIGRYEKSENVEK